MAYEGPFSNRLRDNMVQIIESGIGFAPDPNNTINTDPIILDATETFGIDYSAQITNHPVSDKTDRADNYHLDPVTLNFSGVISNDSIQIYEWVKSLGASKSRCQAYIERMQRIFELKILVEIRMPDGVITKNCLISSLSISRDAQWSNGFRVSIQAQQIKIASGEITKQPLEEKADAVSSTPKTGGSTTTKAKVATVTDKATGNTKRVILQDSKTTVTTPGESVTPKP